MVKITLYQQLLEKIGNKERLQNEIDLQIRELNNLIDSDGALIILAHKYGIKKATENDEKNSLDKTVLNENQKLFQAVANSRDIRTKMYECSEKTENGFLKTLKFAPEPAKLKENDNRIYTGEDFACYLFVMSIKKRYSVEWDNHFTTITALVFNIDKNTYTKPKLRQIIVPTFMKELCNNNNYYTLFKVYYEGLIDIGNNRTYHKGNVLRLAKFNKTIQSTLN